MTKEQEEAIEMLEDIKNNTWTTKYIMSSDSKKAETVLNMLKEKDKLLDLMANYLAINGVERDICNEKRIKENCKTKTLEDIAVHTCKKCIKQYFKEIAEQSSSIN